MFCCHFFSDFSLSIIWTYFLRIGCAIKSLIPAQIHPQPWPCERSWVCIAALVMLEDLAAMYKTISFLSQPESLVWTYRAATYLKKKKFFTSCMITEVWLTRIWLTWTHFFFLPRQNCQYQNYFPVEILHPFIVKDPNLNLLLFLCLMKSFWLWIPGSMWFQYVLLHLQWKPFLPSIITLWSPDHTLGPASQVSPLIGLGHTFLTGT